ncbi:phosphatidylinositol 4,5-bisphosphate 5-phosphatase A isoform X2 [Callorhinchus milii]|uniref:phosphatidylinositol 4,5-bisphosphate 5-phosphatase A isoform X2 n=1 Tax=Callorhinchus milii TaxID=7868 RepID=UPI001C3FCF38|nr:phosphatidylinositol 4,5-bisphosphate 5-phosphatase A isoform X2 [Callorhinchus milii]
MHLVTWNVGTAVPPDDVTSLLGLNAVDRRIDMFVIGLQEVNSMINKRLKDAIFTDQWSELFMDTLNPFGYVLVTSERMQGQLLLLFAKYYHLPYLQDIQTDCTRTGLGGYWGNKGGISARLSLYGHMICFLNCHLPAHLENSEQRMESFQNILQLQQFSGRSANGVLDHDLLFWFGDLNFRIEQYDIQSVKNAIDRNKLGLLWDKDQLNIAKVMQPALDGFQEGLLNFRPTYKYDVGTNTYDTSSKKRKPAWTDRILWRVKVADNYNQSVGRRPGEAEVPSVQVFQCSYRSHMEYLVSDHKPVAAVFSLKFAHKLELPLVQLQVEDEWTKPADAVVRYRMDISFPKSSWDWIGLYKISLPSSSSHSSLSDSSDSSSDEEQTSTLSLIRPNSRSPSPGKRKQRGSRSRSKSPVASISKSLQGLKLGGKSKSKSRSPSPRRYEQLKEPGANVARAGRGSPETSSNTGNRLSPVVASEASAAHGKGPAKPSGQATDQDGKGQSGISSRCSKSPAGDRSTRQAPSQPGTGKRSSAAPNPSVQVTAADSGLQAPGKAAVSPNRGRSPEGGHRLRAEPHTAAN